MLDTCLSVGCIPKRYSNLKNEDQLDLYFAMARVIQNEQIDCTTMEMTKWFDTNYHYIVSEFEKEETVEFFKQK